MQSAHDYGFILDATPNDFVSGELESAIVRCDRELAPQLILIEGQSALRNQWTLWSGIFISPGQGSNFAARSGRELYKTTERLQWRILRMTSRSFNSMVLKYSYNS